MPRYLCLVVLNVVGWIAVLAASRMGLFSPFPGWVDASFAVSLGLPLLPLLMLQPDKHWIGFDMLTVVLIPFTWAAMVEWGLRRYVDRPEESDPKESDPG